MAVQSVGTNALNAALQSNAVATRPAADAAQADALRVDQARRTQASAAAQTERAVDPAQAAPEASRDELDHALEAVRKVVEPVARNLQFTVDEDTGRTVVKVIDSSTQEVIRQIPSKEILSIAKALDKLQGLLIKQEA